MTWRECKVAAIERAISYLQARSNKMKVVDQIDELGYEDLAPSRNINATSYFNALQYALNNPEIKNIAVTGNYGSGKSSMIKSFEKLHPEFNYLNISLATFDDKANKDDETRKQIEISILQQMFYRVKHKKIPDSRFKRIAKLSKLKQSLYAVLFMVWVASLCIVFKIKFFKNIFDTTQLSTLASNIIHIGSLVIFLLGTYSGIFFLLRPVRNAKLNKLNFIEGDIEISDIGEASVLNKFLDEILYFFEANKIDTVIIEDLDRFKDPSIFTKLREINNLLNNSLQINRRIVFVYAIKDEIFVTHNRAKFFEFIIPIIPVISTTNSVDVLFKKLDKAGLRYEVPDNIISDIMLYIDDMRILKNIVNEYILYGKILDNKLNRINLFGIVVYKNMYPEDYSLLSKNEGKAYRALTNKPTYVKAAVEELNKEIKQIENEIESFKKVVIPSIKELRSVYVLAILNRLADDAFIRLDGQKVERKNLTSDDYFEKMRAAGVVTYYSVGSKSLDFTIIEKDVDPHKTYLQRVEEIEYNNARHINLLKQKIEAVNQRIHEIRTDTFKEIISRQGADLVDDDIRSEKLLFFLLRNGYIDEMYPEYISHFYEGSISREDKDFILSIKNFESLPYDHELKKVQEVAKRLTIKEYGQQEALNYLLIDHLLQNSLKYEEQINAITDLLSKGYGYEEEFIDGYFIRGKHIPQFIKRICSTGSDHLDYVAVKSNYTDEKKAAYFDAVIRYCNLDDLVELNASKSLSEYILSRPDFLKTYSDPALYERITTIIRSLNIKFSIVDSGTATDKLMKYIVTGNYYELNVHMVLMLLNQLESAGKNDDEWKTIITIQNYTAIKFSGIESLYKYVLKNINAYVEQVFVQITTNVSEKEDSLLELLNSTEITENNKLKILRQQQWVFESLDGINPENWKVVFESNRIKPMWENIIKYYTNAGLFNDTLISFLNEPDNFSQLTTKQLGHAENATTEEKDNLDKMKTEILTNNNISDENYEKLLYILPQYFSDFPFASLNLHKVNTLIASRKLFMTENNYWGAKSYGHNAHISFLEIGVYEYIEKKEDAFKIDHSDYLPLLNSTKIPDSEKAGLINRIDSGTIEPLAVITNILLTCAPSIKAKLNSDIIVKLILSATSSLQKLEILTAQIPYCQLTELVLYLLEMPSPYAEVLATPLTKLDLVELNWKFGEVLFKRGFISSVKADQSKMKVRIRAKKVS